MRVEGDDRLAAALIVLRDRLDLVVSDLIAGVVGGEDRHELSVVFATLAANFEQGARAGDAAQRDSAASPACLGGEASW